MPRITVQETKETMCAIAKERLDALKARMGEIPKENRYEKKACAIASNMLGVCAHWPGGFDFGRQGKEKHDWWAGRVFDQAKGSPSELFTDYREACDALEEEERGAFLTYAHTLYMIHNAFFYKHYRDLLAFEDADRVPDHPDDIFACRVILTTVGEILTDWKTWWNGTGVLPCGVGYWEEYMAREVN